MYFLYEGDERNQMGVLVIFCSPKIAFSFISAKGTRLGMEKKTHTHIFRAFSNKPLVQAEFCPGTKTKKQ